MDQADTEHKYYTDRLLALDTRLKRLLGVQLPYRLHLQKLRLGFVLDIGCGIGRNLLNLKGSGVGVDHNPHSVSVARSRGLIAYTPEEFLDTNFAREAAFDAILISHVLEHMKRDEAVVLVKQYLPFLKSGGRVLMITPQERGFGSDATHMEFMNFGAHSAIAVAAGLSVEKFYSFPFPRIFGSVFKYNEFVTIACK